MIQKIQTGEGSRWEVRIRDGGRGSREIRRRFRRKEDAQRFETEAIRTKQLGQLLTPLTTRETLDEYAADWWERAQPQLALTSRINYKGALRRYVLPQLGHTQLTRLTPAAVSRFKDTLIKQGRGAATIRYAGQVLSAICADAVLHGQLQTNPCRSVRWPTAQTRAVRPLSPLEVEQIRDQLPTDQDAVLVSLLAYAGLRPQEALALTWPDIRDKTIIIDKAVTHGTPKPTKTNKNRWVALLQPLADDLNTYRKTLTATPGPGALIFPHPHNPAEHWGDSTYRNWRDRTFTPAAKRAGHPNTTPYTLRHSFVSLLLAAGQRRGEVAEQAGHSLTVMEETYAHTIEEYRGTTITNPAHAIQKARTTNTNQRQQQASTASSDN